MSKHTPGPWDDGHHYQGQLAIQADNGRLVALCGRLALDEAQLENQANARLIAAAPELMEALSLLVAGIEDSVSPTFVPLAKARDAIAKATGEQA
jgi:hypothetical protein